MFEYALIVFVAINALDVDELEHRLTLVVFGDAVVSRLVRMAAPRLRVLDPHETVESSEVEQRVALATRSPEPRVACSASTFSPPSGLRGWWTRTIAQPY